MNNSDSWCCEMDVKAEDSETGGIMKDTMHNLYRNTPRVKKNKQIQRNIINWVILAHLGLYRHDRFL